MEELFKEITKPVRLTDVVVLGSYEEVDSLDLAKITKRDGDKGKSLSGMILRGYETKFADGTNENGERYAKTSLDKFVAKYYGENGLNMPLTIQHRGDMSHLAGRVLALEVNSVGFYFVVYVPKSLPEYGRIKTLVEEGILQGLSKEGWATKGKCYYTKEGDFDYFLIEEMEMTAVSLVATPANGNALENAQEIRDALSYVNKTNNAKEDNAAGDEFEAMFN